MKTPEIPLLSAELTNERIRMPYPHIRLLDTSDAVALMLPELPVGDLPVICEYGGVTRQIGSIKKSALVLNNLLKISRLIYVADEKSTFNLTNVESIMEIF